MTIRAVSKTTPLLELINQRWQEFIKDIPDPTLHAPAARPVFALGTDWQLREAARLYAQSDHSDPFAYGRAMRYMRQGYWLPSEVRTDARARIQARVAAGINIPFSEGARA
jgi:hypothetical protein